MLNGNKCCFRIKPFIPIANEPLLKLDRSGRKFEHCLEHSEPVLNIADLKQFLPCTCNLDPYLNKLIRGIVQSKLHLFTLLALFNRICWVFLYE